MQNPGEFILLQIGDIELKLSRVIPGYFLQQITYRRKRGLLIEINFCSSDFKTFLIFDDLTQNLSWSDSKKRKVSSCRAICQTIRTVPTLGFVLGRLGHDIHRTASSAARWGAESLFTPPNLPYTIAPELNIIKNDIDGW